MLARLLCALAALTLACSPAAAWPVHGGGAAPSVPTVIPGSATPNVFTSGWTPITPAYHGSSGDNGYNIHGFARWDSIPLHHTVTGSIRIGLVAAHPSTDTEKAAGLESNICSVDMRANRGSWFTITAPTNNPDAGNVLSWNANFNASDFGTDGIQQVDALVHPCTGPDIAVEGPLADQYGNGYIATTMRSAYISNGGLGVAGNILTIRAANNGDVIDGTHGGTVSPAVVSLGQSVEMAHISGAIPFIDGDSTHNNTSCAAQTGSNCTGAGQGGTYHVSQSQLAAGGVGVGSISGNILTITSMTTGKFYYTQQLLGGSTVTSIGGDGYSGANLCFAQSGSNCTGHGGVGTYYVADSQTVGAGTTFLAPNQGSLNNSTSFYFLTNKNGTISRPITYVSTGGNDGNNCTTSGTACATIGRAITVIRASGTNTGNYGGTICLMGGGTYAYSGQIPGQNNGQLGPYVFWGAQQPPCNAPGDPGGATLINDTASWQWIARNAGWGYINFLGAPDPQTGSAPAVMWVDHVTQVHDQIDGGGLLRRGTYCVDSLTFFGGNGACETATMIRGVTAKYAADGDGTHDTPVLLNNTFDGLGNTMEWVQGRFDGTNVIKDVTLLPSELAGYTLSSIFNTTSPYTLQQKGIAPGQPGWNCFTTTLQITAVDDVNHTITLDPANTPSGNCAVNTVGWFFLDGAHADAFQLGGNVYNSDIYVSGNTYGTSYPSYYQGFFVEPFGVAGQYYGDNVMNSDLTGVEPMPYPIDGGDDIMISARNLFNTNANNGNYMAFAGTDNMTMIKDQCTQGIGLMVPVIAGLNYRASRATGSNYCYATTTP